MRLQLLKEVGKQSLISILIFGGLLAILVLIEQFVPAVKGALLLWNDQAFVVGIPASVIGVAYVLTIRNPKNYMGFYLGIVMSILLATQFYIRAQYDLVVLYTVVFIPFLIMSLLKWRKNTLTSDEQKTLQPSFISRSQMRVVQIACLLLLIIDYIINTTLVNKDGWTDNFDIKLTSGIMICSSFWANYLLIYQKNDAWICWILYSIAGIWLGIIMHNVFSMLLFGMFFLVNASAQRAWLLITDTANFGWGGDKEHIEQLRNKHEQRLNEYEQRRNEYRQRRNEYRKRRNEYRKRRNEYRQQWRRKKNRP